MSTLSVGFLEPIVVRFIFLITPKCECNYIPKHQDFQTSNLEYECWKYFRFYKTKCHKKRVYNY